MDPQPALPPPGRRPGVGPIVGVVVACLIGCAILAAAVLALVVPAGRFPLSRVALSGVQVEVPMGTRETSGDYRNGKVRAKTPFGRLVVQVSWEPGPAFDEAELPRLLDAIAPAIGATPADVKRGEVVWVPGGLAAQSWKIVPVGKPAMWGTMVVCGGRRVSITTAGREATLEQLHRRVAATLVCQVDPTGEASLGDVPAVMDLPGDWLRVRGEVDQIVLTDKRVVILTRTLNGKVTDDMVTKVLPAAFAGQLSLGARREADWPVRGMMDGEELLGWLTVRHCPERGQSLMTLSLHDDGPGHAEAARKLLGKVRCRRMDEPAQVWRWAPGQSPEK